MEGTLKITTGMVRRSLRAHLFLTAIIVGVLIGGGLRFLPSSAAAAPGSAGSTACAAK